MDPKIRKKVLRKISYGIYILISETDESISAATITWISQASFEPPLLMIGLNRNSKIYDSVIKSRKFSINLLFASQKNMAAAFFKDTVYNKGKSNGYEVEIGKTGVTVFKNIDSYFECSLIKVINGGDHDILIAEIKNAENFNDGETLNLQDTRWKYGG